MKRVIYLDNAATTQPFPEVLDAMLPFYKSYYGNPSSGYELGEESKKAVEQARKMVAATLYTKPENIYFTSGGTEADNWALRFAVDHAKNRNQAEAEKAQDRSISGNDFRPHIITSAIEHHAVLRTCERLEKEGVRVTYIPVSKEGIVDLRQLEKAICDRTVLISVMYANNEIGTIQPIGQIAAVARRHNVLFHTDAVQAYGQIPIEPVRLGIDLMSASGHKFNGPKGTGFLYVRNGLELKPLLYGGGQERKMRAGTENVPGIVGLGRAARMSHQMLKQKIRYETMLRDYLIGRIFREIPDVKLNGSPSLRLPGNVNISFSGINGGAVVALMDLEGICVSAASACSAGSKSPSHVQLAIGNTGEEAYGAVRFTLGMQNTKEELDKTVEVLKKTVARLREME